MLKHIYILVICLISFELLKFFNFVDLFKKNLIVYTKIRKLFLSKSNSDIRKEKLSKIYSLKLLILSFKILFLCLIILSFFIIPYFFNFELFEYLLSPYSFFEILIIFTLYYFIRRKIND